MNIIKKFKSETAHIVRDAYSTRCSLSIHGHSYLFELELSSSSKDNAGMVTDFGFIKKYIGPLFDSFDHSAIIGKFELSSFKKFFKDNFERVIISDWNSTAEFQAAFFFFAVENIIKYLNNNKLWEKGEKQVTVSSVTVHETTTGRAKYDIKDSLNKNDDYAIYFNYGSNVINTVDFSMGIQNDWTPEFKKCWNALKTNK